MLNCCEEKGKTRRRDPYSKIKAELLLGNVSPGVETGAFVGSNAVGECSRVDRPRNSRKSDERDHGHKGHGGR